VGIKASVTTFAQADLIKKTASVVVNCGVEGTIGLNVVVKMGKSGNDLMRGYGTIAPKAVISTTYTIKSYSLNWGSAADTAAATTAAASTTAAAAHSQHRALAEINMDYATVGTVFSGSMVMIKDPYSCGSPLLPPYLNVSATVVGSTALGNGGSLSFYVVTTFGDAQFTDGTDRGAFAAVTQGAYILGFYGNASAPQQSCSESPSALFGRDTGDTSVDYAASTVPGVALPDQYGLLCEGGNKIVLQDTLRCYKTTLSRQAAPDAGGDQARRHLATAKELQAEFGHTKYLKAHRSLASDVCDYAVSRGPTPAPTTAKPATARPTALPTAAPSTAAPVTAAPTTAAPTVVGQTSAPTLPSGVSAKVATGFAHTCVIRASGSVVCFGSGSRGALGYNSTNKYVTIVATTTATAAQHRSYYCYCCTALATLHCNSSVLLVQQCTKVLTC
jgi:Regulator of chromosome condensation (RCC1) repeat